MSTTRIDRELAELRLLLREATDEMQRQTIGLRCRELLITLAQTVFVRDRHKGETEEAPRKSDAHAMLTDCFSVELRGQWKEEARAYAKTALRLANALTHDRSATSQMAELCAHATVSVMVLVAIIDGRWESI